MPKPILIDPLEFAEAKKRLDFRITLSNLDHRTAKHEYIANPDIVLNCSLHGGTDRFQRYFLELNIRADMQLWCQRCMLPMPFQMDETARLVLFSSEAELNNAMDTDEDLEGLILSKELDILPLVEDQILLALPYSPVHESCTNSEIERINQNKQPNPFAALADLTQQSLNK